MFGSERDEMTGSLRILHNVELHNSYYSVNVIMILSRMRLKERVECMGEMRNAYRILVRSLNGGVHAK
jgi:hypothetical protein